MATGAWTEVESTGDYCFPEHASFDHSYSKNWWEKVAAGVQADASRPLRGPTPTPLSRAPFG